MNKQVKYLFLKISILERKVLFIFELKVKFRCLIHSQYFVVFVTKNFDLSQKKGTMILSIFFCQQAQCEGTIREFILF